MTTRLLAAAEQMFIASVPLLVFRALVSSEELPEGELPEELPDDDELIEKPLLVELVEDVKVPVEELLAESLPITTSGVSFAAITTPPMLQTAFFAMRREEGAEGAHSSRRRDRRLSSCRWAFAIGPGGLPGGGTYWWP